MSQGYRNFDEAVRETEDRTTKFTFEGRDFEVNLNVKAGPLLKWMRSASRVEGIPTLLEMFFTPEEFEWMLNSSADWSKMEELMLYLIQELGDSGNSEESGGG